MAVVSSLRPVSGSAEEILALLREWDAAASPDPLVIATSGSTGLPKRVVLSRDAMRASALATQERLGGPGQWVLNLPPTYVAGVQVLYRSVVAGTSPVTEIGELTGDRCYLSLVPTQLVRALDGDVDLLRRLDAVLVGGGPLNPLVRERAEARGVTDRADLRDERDLRRLRVRRSAARRCRGADRATARCSCAGRCCSTATRTTPSGPRP